MGKFSDYRCMKRAFIPSLVDRSGFVIVAVYCRYTAQA